MQSNFPDVSEEQAARMKTALENSDIIVEFFESNSDIAELEDSLALQDFMSFTSDLLHYTDEFEWIAHLREVAYNELEEYDEPCESDLWNAGHRLHQRYYICMYALYVCSEKLKQQKGNKVNE
jgi:hypothetical protein